MALDNGWRTAFRCSHQMWQRNAIAIRVRNQQCMWYLTRLTEQGFIVWLVSHDHKREAQTRAKWQEIRMKAPWIRTLTYCVEHPWKTICIGQLNQRWPGCHLWQTELPYKPKSNKTLFWGTFRKELTLWLCIKQEGCERVEHRKRKREFSHLSILENAKFGTALGKDNHKPQRRTGRQSNKRPRSEEQGTRTGQNRLTYCYHHGQRTEFEIHW